MDRKIRILLVEDDPGFGAVLHDYLELHNYDVSLSPNGVSGLSMSQKKDFDLYILDVMMPEMDGFTLAKEIRKKSLEIPLIFVTAKTLKSDVMEGYKIGAEDYITKPFDSEVLLYKIKAILKRKDTYKPVEDLASDFTMGSYHFNWKLRVLKRNQKEQKLSPKEADLLRLLCAHQNDILPRQVALRTIWGEDNFFTGRSMDVFMVKLRKFFKDDPKVTIENIHSSGYRLVVE